MGGFFSFDKMITPIFIKFFFLVGVIVSVIGSFVSIWMGAVSQNGSFVQVIIGIVMLCIGPILIRIYCEMLIVFFKMQESLIQIRDIQREPLERGGDL